jgi:DNA repair protein RadC
MRDPQVSAAALTSLLRDEAVEVFGILCLTTKLPRHLLACQPQLLRLSDRAPAGGLQASPSREFRSGPDCDNHPSGDPEPSPNDIALARRLAAAGAILDIELLDHIIVGDGTFVSLKQIGRMESTAAPPVMAACSSVSAV